MNLISKIIDNKKKRTDGINNDKSIIYIFDIFFDKSYNQFWDLKKKFIKGEEIW